MRIPHPKKTKLTTIRKMLTNWRAMVVYDFRGLSTNQTTELRLRAASEGVVIKVFPASLLKTALVERNIPIPPAVELKDQLMCVSGQDVSGIVIFLRSVGKTRLRFAIETARVFVSQPHLASLYDAPAIEVLQQQLLQIVKQPLLNLNNTLESMVRNRTTHSKH